MVLMITLSLMAVWVIPLIGSRFGATIDDLAWIIFPLFGFILIYNAGAIFSITCPKCGRSVFQRDYGIGVPLWTPWPARSCGNCGHDLREV
ncbi:MAG: hypothetical protein CL955_05365 [Erythrobacteraceae bacterium]|nr:hypothetical protein [Erythrobacteraceae bacterium]